MEEETETAPALRNGMLGNEKMAHCRRFWSEASFKSSGKFNEALSLEIDPGILFPSPFPFANSLALRGHSQPSPSQHEVSLIFGHDSALHVHPEAVPVIWDEGPTQP